MEIQEIVERIDNVTNSINSAFDNGSIDLDQIVKELESLKPALIAMGERLSDATTIRNPLKLRLQGMANQSTLMDISIGDYQ